MARRTLEEQRIDVIIESYNLKPMQVLYLTRVMLQLYKLAKSGVNPDMPSMTKEEIIADKRYMRREFLRLMRKEGKRYRKAQEQFIARALRAPWIWDKIVYLLEDVADFKGFGTVYKEILMNAYFIDTPMTNDEIVDNSTDLTDDTIGYRKREAIKLFGIKIWGYALRRENEDIVAGLIEKDTDEEDDTRR